MFKLAEKMQRLEEKGLSPKEVAEKLGITPSLTDIGRFLTPQKTTSK